MIEWLADYKRGSMGAVQQLEAPLLYYLRTAEAAEGEWQMQSMRRKK